MRRRVFSRVWGSYLLLGDIYRLEALGALLDIELHRIALIEAAIAGSLDSSIVNKHIFTGGTLNEAVPLFTVEPLDSTFLHGSPLCK